MGDDERPVGDIQSLRVTFERLERRSNILGTADFENGSVEPKRLGGCLDLGTACRAANAASCAPRLKKNESELITSPPARSWSKLAKTVSKSRSALARST